MRNTNVETKSLLQSCTIALILLTIRLPIADARRAQHTLDSPESVHEFELEIDKILHESESPSLARQLHADVPRQMHGSAEYFADRGETALKGGNFATAAQLFLFAARAAAAKREYEAAIGALEQSAAIQSHLSASQRLDRAEGIVALFRQQDSKKTYDWIIRLRQAAKNAVIDLPSLDDEFELRKLGVTLAILYSEDRLVEAKHIQSKYETLKKKIESSEVRKEIAEARSVEFGYISQEDYRGASEEAHKLLRLQAVSSSPTECLPEIATLIRCSIADKNIPSDDAVQQLITAADNCPVQGNARIDKLLVPILDLSGSQLLQRSPLMDVVQKQTFKLMMKAGGFCDRPEYVIHFYKYLDATGRRSEAIRISDIVATHLENILRTNEALSIREFELSQLRPEQLKETNHLDLAIIRDKEEIARDASFLHLPNPFPATDEN